MNAGAWGEAMGEHVSSIRGLNLEGHAVIVKQTDLEWSYRSCQSLRDLIVLDAEIMVSPSKAADVAEKRQVIRGRRSFDAT